MAPAFVTGPAVATRSSTFSGAAVPACPTSSPANVTMSSSPISRRKALQTAAAVLAGVPLAALAKSGDSPKISIFGVGGFSSPFTAGVTTGGQRQYAEYNDDEIMRFKRIVNESKDRIIAASGSVKSKSWDDLKSCVRLEAYEVRRIQRQVDASLDGDKKKAATKASQAFKVSLEEFDQAVSQKSPAKTAKAYDATIKTLSAWQKVVGFDS